MNLKTIEEITKLASDGKKLNQYAVLKLKIKMVITLLNDQAGGPYFNFIIWNICNNKN